MKLHILLPDRVSFCMEDPVAAVKRALKEAVIQFERRQFTVTARPESDLFQLWDIPTPMAVMDASITKRAGILGEPNRESETWQDVERAEVNRFFLELQQWIKGNSREFQNRVEIVRFSCDGTYARELAWLYDIWC
jgi:hypothetical protein